MKRHSIPAFLALFCAPGLALAHPGHADGLLAGLAHPYSGLDHLLAMLAVGLWAAQRRDGAPWRLPLAFLAAMLAGAGLAQAGVALPQVEAGVAASVLLLGLALAFALRLPDGAALALVAVFAVCHGHAHGSEATGGLAAYGLGFLLATASLHGLGLAAGGLVRRLSGALLRAAGLGIAAAGAWLAYA